MFLNGLKLIVLKLIKYDIFIIIILRVCLKVILKNIFSLKSVFEEN